MAIRRRGSAQWQGGFREGKGAISTESGALRSYPYGVLSRFEAFAGTNPEELIGAAHAGCFAMALARVLSQQGIDARRLDVRAEVSLEDDGEGYRIDAVHLVVRASLDGLDAARFDALVAEAERTCPVSRVLQARITLDARMG